MRLLMRKYVWDMEYGPGGSGDFKYKWKRDNSGKMLLPEEFTSYCNTPGLSELDLEMEEISGEKSSDYLDAVEILSKRNPPVFKIQVDGGENNYIFVPI
jgi:hypothetical protein